MTACLNSEGKQPETSDVLNSKVTKGDSRLRISFTSHVGTGSSWHVLVGAEPISLVVLTYSLHASVCAIGPLSIVGVHGGSLVRDNCTSLGPIVNKQHHVNLHVHSAIDDLVEFSMLHAVLNMDSTGTLPGLTASRQEFDSRTIFIARY